MQLKLPSDLDADHVSAIWYNLFNYLRADDEWERIRAWAEDDTPGKFCFTRIARRGHLSTPAACCCREELDGDESGEEKDCFAVEKDERGILDFSQE